MCPSFPCISLCGPVYISAVFLLGNTNMELSIHRNCSEGLEMLKSYMLPDTSGCWFVIHRKVSVDKTERGFTRNRHCDWCLEELCTFWEHFLPETWKFTISNNTCRWNVLGDHVDWWGKLEDVWIIYLSWNVKTSKRVYIETSIWTPCCFTTVLQNGEYLG